MKFLVDESLSERLTTLLTNAGHDASHVAQLGLRGALDEEVMAAARDSGRVLVSGDTDFGELLAIGRHVSPSLVLFRRAPHHPTQQLGLLLAALPRIEHDLEGGAVVVLSSTLIRIRRLPIADQ